MRRGFEYIGGVKCNVKRNSHGQQRVSLMCCMTGLVGADVLRDVSGRKSIDRGHAGAQGERATTKRDGCPLLDFFWVGFFLLFLVTINQLMAF